MKLVRALCISLVVLVSSSFSALIELIQELNFTVPMLQGEIVDFDFNDVDGDGFPEILACDTSLWVLYSIFKDSILAWDTLPKPAYSSQCFSNGSESNTRLLLGDVYDDQSLDVSISRFVTLLGYCPDASDSTAVLAIYNSNTNYELQLARFYDAGNCTWSCAIGNIGALELIDLNLDGHDELVYAYANTGYSNCCEGSSGVTTVFNSSLDSIAAFYYRGLSYSPVLLADSSLVYLTEEYRSIFIQTGDPTTAMIQNIGYADSIGAFHKWRIKFPSLDLTPCDGYYYWFFDSSSKLGCIGDFIVEEQGEEIVVLNEMSLDCRAKSGVPLISQTDLVAYKLISADSITEVWKVESVQSVYDNFMYHPLFPGYFFAFIDNAFTQFRGEDGSVFQFTTNVPTGTREWDYPFNDSIQRLIVRNGTSVSIYNTDISTPVHENQPFNLPNSFELSQPYPNPFNPEVNFTLSVPTKSPVKVEVFDILGRQIETVYEGEVSAGELKLNWNADNNPSGVYLIKASCGEFVKSVKAVLLK